MKKLIKLFALILCLFSNTSIAYYSVVKANGGGEIDGKSDIGTDNGKHDRNNEPKALEQQVVGDLKMESVAKKEDDQSINSEYKNIEEIKGEMPNVQEENSDSIDASGQLLLITSIDSIKPQEIMQALSGMKKSKMIDDITLTNAIQNTIEELQNIRKEYKKAQEYIASVKALAEAVTEYYNSLSALQGYGKLLKYSENKRELHGESLRLYEDVFNNVLTSASTLLQLRGDVPIK